MTRDYITLPLSSLLLAAVLIVVQAPALAAQTKPHANTSHKERQTYRWVDEKGVVHYGDSVPAQYSKQERQVLNEQGVEIQRLEAEKTDAQRADEEAHRRALQDAKQRDQILLNTYVSVEQIEEVRDQRLDLIEGQVKVTSQYLDTLRGRLQSLHTRTQFFSPYSSNQGAGPMPDDLAEDLVRTVKDIRLQERGLASKRAEQGQLRDRFESDIQRFMELKGIKTSSAE